MTRIDLTPMGGRQGYAWLGGTALAVLLLSAFVAVTQPENRPFTLFGPLMVVGFVYVLKRHRHWLEVSGDDVVLVQRRAFRTLRADVATATEVSLRSNGAGTAQLVVRGPGGAPVAGLLLSSQYAQGYQGPEVLDPLVRALSGSRARGAREVLEVLRKQAEHARSGGPVETAPLAAYARDHTAAIGAAGAAGAASGLADPR